ncbi:hypothetical protein RB594_001589 [Gaeumannomyces avenae]
MPPRKRKAPAASKPKPAPKPAASGRRQSQRIGSSAKKSQYFETGSDSDADPEPAAKRARKGAAAAKYTGRRGPKPESDESEDAYQEPDGDDDDDDDDDKDVTDEEEKSSAGEEDDDDDNDDAPKPKSKQKSAQATRGKGRPASKKQQPDDDNEDDDDDDDAEPRVTFIPHKKLRDTGGVEYADDRVHPNTLLFLGDLRANNKRAWLKANDGEYRRSLKDWNAFVEALQARLMAEDETLPELPVKDLSFRIYRDVRFSKEKTPYKPHYSAAFSRTGRKGPYACYYVHCEPGSCFVGGGLWHPDADALHRLRVSIDGRPLRWRLALCAEPFRAAFMPGAADEASILAAFAAHNAADALKTKPKGFYAGHRDIELLKLRNFTVSKRVPDEFFTGPDALDRLGDLVGAMVGFITHLNSIAMPDDPAADDGGDDDDDGDEGGGSGSADEA